LPQFISLPSESIDVPENIFLARAGIPPSLKITESLRKRIEEAKRICKELSKPRALYETLGFEIIDEKKFKIEEKTFESKMVNRYFQSCTKVTLIVATLGNEVSEKIDSLFQKDQYSLAFLLDSFASEFVEYFMNRIDEFLRRDMMKKGFIGTKRISPGYEDLHLKINAFIIQRLDSKTRINVNFVEGSYMLIPRKSITAMIGWKSWD